MTLRWARRAAHSPRGDDGFTIVEVLAALMVLAVVATAAAMFMIRSLHASKGLQDRQAAPTAARQVMEQVRSVPGVMTTTTNSKLVQGRSRADVVAAWNEASGYGVDISSTYTGSGGTTFDDDTFTLASGASVNPVVPIRGTTTVSGTDFDYLTLVGTCVRPRAGSECGKNTTGDVLYRIVVLVRWSDAAQTCTDSTCQYTLSTLVDPSEDPSFNTLRKPYAFDDPGNGNPPILALAGDQISIPVLGNDQGYWPLSNAVTIGAAAPSAGGSALTDPASNQVLYKSRNDFSGIETFTYRATNTDGVGTNLATVTVTVRPKAIPDVFNTATRTSTLNVLANDRGSLAGGASVQLLGTPQNCTVAANGVTFSATVPATVPVQQCRFSYTVRDSGGRTSDPADVVLNVNPGAAPTASPLRVQGYAGQTLAVDVATAVTASTGITLTTSTGGVAVNGTTLSGIVPQSGPVVIDYTVTDEWGRTASSFVTLDVVVSAPLELVNQSFSLGTYRSRTLTPSDYVTSGVGPYRVTNVVTTSGSRVTANYSGDQVTFTRGWRTGTTTFTVTVQDARGRSATFEVEVR